MKKEQIQAISISLDYDKKQSLYILLTSDGFISRMGNGQKANTNLSFYTGKIKDEIFIELLKNISEEMMNFTGKFELEKEGVPCRLIILLYSQEENIRFEFTYGSQFAGLPDEIHNLLVKSISLTDDWYNVKLKKA